MFLLTSLSTFLSLHFCQGMHVFEKHFRELWRRDSFCQKFSLSQALTKQNVRTVRTFANLSRLWFELSLRTIAWGIGGFRHCSHVQPPYGACSSIRCIKCVTQELANPEFHGLTSKLYAQDPNTYKPWVTVSKPDICQCVSCLGNSVNLTKLRR